MMRVEEALRGDAPEYSEPRQPPPQSLPSGIFRAGYSRMLPAFFSRGSAPAETEARSTPAAAGKGGSNPSLIAMSTSAKAGDLFVPLWTEPLFLQQFADQIGDQSECQVGSDVARTPCSDDAYWSVRAYRKFVDDHAASCRRVRATAQMACTLYAEVLSQLASGGRSGNGGEDAESAVSLAPRDHSPAECDALRRLATYLRRAARFEARHDALRLAQQQHCNWQREQHLTFALAARLGRTLQDLGQSQQFILFGPRELKSLVFAIERVQVSGRNDHYSIVVANSGGPGLEYHPNDARGRCVPVVCVTGIPKQKMLSAATLWFLVR